MLARLLALARGLARRNRITAEVDEELQFHLEREVDAHIARGVPATEARRIALRDLGGLTQTREAVSDVRRIGSMTCAKTRSTLFERYAALQGSQQSRS